MTARIKPLTGEPLAGPREVTPASMAADRRKFFARLEELGIACVTVEHEPVFTVEQSRALRETIPGAHTKNLFLADRDGRVALVVAKDDARVDLKRVASRLGFGRSELRQTRAPWHNARRHAGFGHAVCADQRSSTRACGWWWTKRCSPSPRSIAIRWKTPRRRGLPPGICCVSSAPAGMSRWSVLSPEPALGAVAKRPFAAHLSLQIRPPWRRHARRIGFANPG